MVQMLMNFKDINLYRCYNYSFKKRLQHEQFCYSILYPYTDINSSNANQL